MPALHLATFSCDVTPSEGHPLCGGWIEPVRGVDDPLKTLGIVLLGAGKPVVLCAVDWTGLRNEAFRTWRKALADAAHTTPEYVSLHCVHPHNAPFADTGAEKLIAAAKAPTSLDLKFFDRCVTASAEALSTSLMKAVRFTHVGTGLAEVKEVASNRRVLGDDGKVRFTRTSATKSKEAREAAEGMIDPKLRTLSFWDGEKPLAGLHFYACHPMSYYGDGRVSADFCGLARQKLQDETKVFQMYFNGCGGNVTAGKYNDGSKENRVVLRDRVHTAMASAWKATRTTPVTDWRWRFESVILPPRKEAAFGEAESTKVLNDPKATAAKRNNAAFQLAWLARQDVPVEVSCLSFGGAIQTLFLPGEAFVEYQLAAQKLRPDAVVNVAAYGDDGPGYIPTAKAYLEGGYEPTVALSGPGSEELLLAAIRKLLKPEGKGKE
ncbi:hypothetical protein GobsT_38410 [Gemmata obscuriglobus]|uniref:Neutral/alkaline non-lysosomal ceramidase N-terminal domain-containing protein n=1 Tax=Gemmata obscuriglobus TaxID=114 RepID=A0A2Z3H168_9BACT|nr:hypothetical protein [Gemmata obscuriglobus]AWM38072.1 hypothetical protein C1280_14435 [Gemmata obscuriglobus]QEG29052.1 hypothetical protein GobsT_38410 [Gemmata obscuriglobus]VTS07679.1 Uncharacterized protein OS=Singulisphaera acidiphila (strain ATCC BAA-1392 / DSM 18658 / VKM B-2454 / MOB10) GN=Sinac_3020 PE=4 SV=1 [Gemmata obscuriglobus UQM 2246]